MLLARLGKGLRGVMFLEILTIAIGVGGGILLAWLIVMLIKYYPQIKG